ncbi:MAG: hypothetical protein IJZ33_01520 [Clostridia bacterium]|nr:hypothetical protein [Clostridia bacterium]
MKISTRITAILMALLLGLTSLTALVSCDETSTTNTPLKDPSSPSPKAESLPSLSESHKESPSIIKPSLPSPTESLSSPSLEEEQPDLDADPALVGSWKTDMDITELYVSMFTMMMEPEMTEYFDFEGFSFLMSITLEMDEEGRYAVTFDEDIVKDSTNELLKIVKAGMKDYMTVSFTAEAEKLGTTLKDYLEYVFEEEIEDTDAYLEALTEESLGGLGAEDLGTPEPEHGLYGVKEGKLYFYMEDDIVFEEDYMIYSLEDGILKLDLPEEQKGDMENELIDVLPMLFSPVG